MNAKLSILAILTILVAALFMSASAPAEDTIVRMTLGGDCSADRATGDLYHISDPYCIVDERTGSVPVETEGRGDQSLSGGQSLRPGYASVTSNAQSSDQGDNPVPEISTSQLDEQGGNPGEVNPNAQDYEQANSQSNAGSEDELDEQPTAPSDDDSNDQVKSQDNNSDDGSKDPPKKEQSAASGPDNPKDKDEKQINSPAADKLSDQSTNKVEDKGKRQSDDQPSSAKKCKKAERDNTNSQDNHNCSAANPDPNSDQERNTDHNQHENSSDAQNDDQGNHADQSSDKECKKADRDNVNAQGNHNCSADNPDTMSDQQRTTDHGQSEGSQDSDRDRHKDKKDK